MRQIGRVLGIPIRLHPTFLLLLVLVVLSAEPWALSVTLVMVFASVTVHELAHSVVAQHFGIRVRDILLLPIGGVSELERLPDTPRQQLEVAIAGPATSAGIGLVALIMTAASGGAVTPVDLVDGGLLHRLGWLNLTLAGFNLLPALPLDGGRVLRALLAPRVGALRATVTAATAGRAIASALIAIGILYDLWLMIVGLFVLFGASAEQASAVVRARLGGFRVRDVMRPGPPAPTEEVGGPVEAAPEVPDDAPLVDALELLASTDAVEAVVLHEGRPVGVLDAHDVARLIATEDLERRDDHE